MTYENPTFKSPSEVVEELIDNDVKWDVISTILARFPEALDSSLVWGRKKSSLLAYCFSESTSRTYKALPSPSQMALIIKHDPGAISRPDLKGVAPAHEMLSAVDSGAPDRGMDPWLEILPWEDLMSYRSGRYSTSIIPGVDLYETVIRNDDYREHSALEILFRRGLDPNLVRANGLPVATQLCYPYQWTAFLEAGGNPDLVVPAREQNLAAPLWKVLIQGGSAEIREHMEEWSAANRSDALAAKRVADYWNMLRNKSDGYVKSAEVVKLVTAHEDWFEMRDAQDRNPAMFAITMNESAWRALEQKRFAPLLGLRDAAGRSLWNYALSNPRKLNEAGCRWLVSRDIPASPSEITGRGFLADMLLFQDQPGAFGQSQLIPCPPRETWEYLFKKFSAEQWLAFSDQDEDALVDRLLEAGLSSRGVGTFSEFISLLDKAYPDVEYRPRVQGAIALALFANYPNQALSVMESGGTIDLKNQEQARKVIEAAGRPSLAPQLISHVERGNMEKRTAQVSNASRPTSRL